MVVEDQFGVGDIVDLGEAKGTVEKVTPAHRRGCATCHGTVWHVPNGADLAGANKSQEARAAPRARPRSRRIGTDYEQAVARSSRSPTTSGLDPDFAARLIVHAEVGISRFTE